MSESSLVPLRSFPKVAQAREAALALAARGWAYEIDRTGDQWSLLVEEPVAAEALAELATFEAEQQTLPRPAPARTFTTIPWWPLLWAGLALTAIFLAQKRSPLPLTARGMADAQAIWQGGEWWRCLTALTLHGDLAHIGANLALGTLLIGFLLPQWGAGLTWLAILLSGALGNYLNAWGYRGEAHHSLGASTAIFGALGLLTTTELLYRWRAEALGRWRLLVPFGGGLSLLAFLGTGEPHEPIDFTAHLWGFCAGLALGLLLPIFHRLLGRWNWLAGLLALALLLLSWHQALK